MSMTTPMPNRIVCAAVRRGTHIALGVRHYDAIMISALELIGVVRGSTDEQGFVDRFGVFHNRHEAYHVALAAEQIIRRVGGDLGRLFSENLY